jgi:hypothetical protein
MSRDKHLSSYMHPAVISRSVFYRSRMDIFWSKKAWLLDTYCIRHQNRCETWFRNQRGARLTSHLTDQDCWGTAAGGPAGFALRRGWIAFTTMVMFGRKSDSYWTHSAATAANWKTRNIVVRLYCTGKVVHQNGWLMSEAFLSCAYLCNSLWRVVIVELWVDTLLYFVFTQPWSGLLTRLGHL